MAKPKVVVKKLLIFLHRWTGVVLSALFLMWFVSGIVMMYWDYPGVNGEDRLARSPALKAESIRLTPQEAFGTLKIDDPPAQIRLNTFDGRPVYRFGDRMGEHIVYADTGEEQLEVSPPLMRRVASQWTGQAVSAAEKREVISEPDQWTVAGGFRQHRPMNKYSWANGEQVYVSSNTGEVVQYTTTASRLGAWFGAIPHWIYFTPLRQHQPEWSQLVIWTSGIGTITGLMGIVIAVWLLSPSKRYRYAGQPTSVPYKGQKRWHTILGLFFGILACTWAFSGMMSMGVQLPFLGRGSRPATPPPPPPTEVAQKGNAKQGGKRGAKNGDAKGVVAESREGRRGRNQQNGIAGALRGGRVRLEAFAAKTPVDALKQLEGAQVKELEFTLFAGDPVYLATVTRDGKIDGTQSINGFESGHLATRLVPVQGEPLTGIGEQRIMDVVRRAAKPGELAELTRMDEYDRYYIDRHGRKPLPVVLATLNDEDHTRYYIDLVTGRVAGTYSARSFASRWLYHGLHSLDFPWLYKYRPLWDIVVITLMLGGTALCVTSLILTWQVLWRKVAYWTRVRRQRTEHLQPAATAGD